MTQRAGLPTGVRADGRTLVCTGLVVAFLLVWNSSSAHAQEPCVYVVEPGDTASEIAEGARVTLSELRDGNPDVELDRIGIGTELELPATSCEANAADPSDAEAGAQSTQPTAKASPGVPIVEGTGQEVQPRPTPAERSVTSLIPTAVDESPADSEAPSTTDVVEAAPSGLRRYAIRIAAALGAAILAAGVATLGARKLSGATRWSSQNELAVSRVQQTAMGNPAHRPSQEASERAVAGPVANPAENTPAEAFPRRAVDDSLVVPDRLAPAPTNTPPRDDPTKPLVIGVPWSAPEAIGEYGPWVEKFVPAVVCDEGRLGKTEFAAVSAQGRKHQLAGKPRQDSYALATADNSQWFVAAIADGVGSAARSHIGSDHAAKIACHVLVGELERDGGSTAPTGVHVAEVVDRQLRSMFKDPEGVATTLVALAINVDTGACRAYRVGDSKLLQRSEDRWNSLFSQDALQPADGGATYALPGHPEQMQQWSGQLASGSVLLLATDGVADPIADASEVANEFLALLRRRPRLHEFIRLVRFQRKACFDDRTALAIWWNVDDEGKSEAASQSTTVTSHESR